MFYVFIHDQISTTGTFKNKYFCGISKHLKMVLAFCSVMLSFFYHLYIIGRLVFWLHGWILLACLYHTIFNVCYV